LPKGVEIMQQEQIIEVGDPFENWRYLAGDLSSKTGNLIDKIQFLQFMYRNTKNTKFGDAVDSSSEFYQIVIKPFLSGVFLCNPDDVSAEMARELLYWFRKGNPGVPKGGVQTLPDLLAENLNVKFEMRAESIKSGKVITNQGEVESDVIVVAVNQRQAATILGRGKWSMNSSLTWYHSIPAGAINSRHLRFDPRGKIANSVVISNVAPSYSRTERALVSTTSLDLIADRDILQELSNLWQLSPSDFELVKRYEIPESLPKHLPGKPLISDLQIAENIYAIGDYQATPSQQGALLTGRLVAEQIMQKN
jgi:predicted NAD/FAD-dependent oxidoreductase